MNILDELDISTRAYNTLSRGELYTIEDVDKFLKDAGRWQFCRIKYCGKETNLELLKAISELKERIKYRDGSMFGFVAQVYTMES